MREATSPIQEKIIICLPTAVYNSLPILVNLKFKKFKNMTDIIHMKKLLASEIFALVVSNR